ncbi:MAG: hypothetical protein A2Y33_16140 [Spirochaetes bacterium GWF1_51_8]|nr:MAG: hypothetical protein A2Y33_16140 [Spirochaetes bacterium GWF1_51_8]
MDEQLRAVTALAKWFEQNRRKMPWRDDPTPYHVLVSEFMLQQTQVASVIDYFTRFIKRFPSIEALARAPYDEVLKYWAGLGYYARAKSLHETAKRISRMGDFPRTREELLDLPGIGPYTAGAILSIAFDIPEPILDANIERVLSRVERAGEGKDFKKNLWLHASAWVNIAYSHGIAPSVLNQALMELGATVCSPKEPACAECPLFLVCGARYAGQTALYPPSKPKKDWVTVDEEVYCVFNSGMKFLVRKRGEREWRAGLWDLPDILPLPEDKLSFQGAVDLRLTVTHHKIFRTAVVYRYRNKTGPIDREKFRWIGGDELTKEVLPFAPSLLKTMKSVFTEYSYAPEARDEKVDEEGSAE